MSDSRSARLSAVRRAIKAVLPHAIVETYARRKLDAAAKQRAQETTWRREAGRELLQHRTYAPFSYEAAIDYVVERGCDEEKVRGSSMPEASLRRCGELVARRFPTVPLQVLHVGNFVGVSLATITHLLTSTNPGSIVWSVDPGMPHQRVERPLDHALALMSRFGLQNSHVAIAGYSLEKNVGEDGALDRDRDEMISAFKQATACEEVLPNLRALGDDRFHVAIVDGNHDPAYLRREIAELSSLLRRDGLLVLDDVVASRYHPELRPVLDRFLSDSQQPFRLVEEDGRVAVLAKRAANGQRMPGPSVPRRAGRTSP